MNERIKELAEQAGCKVMDGEWYIPSATGVEKIVYTKGIGLEKFAELIVRECMDIAKNWEDQLENSSLLKESNAVGVVAYRIARQFGVKE